MLKRAGVETAARRRGSGLSLHAVPVIADTAYPRLPAEPGPAELEAFTPEAAELAFAGGGRAGLGHAWRCWSCSRASSASATSCASPPCRARSSTTLLRQLGCPMPFPRSPATTTPATASGLSALVRGYVGVAGYDREARGVAVRACIEAARTRDDLADIVNAGIEELFGTAAGAARLRHASQARAQCPRPGQPRLPSPHRRHAAVRGWRSSGRPAHGARRCVPVRLGPGQGRSAAPEPAAHARATWPTSPGCGGKPCRMRRLPACRTASCASSPPRRARWVLPTSAAWRESKRLALMAALLRGQIAQALDDAAEMFVRLTQRMHNRAKEALERAPRPARGRDRRAGRAAARDGAGLPGPGGRPGRQALRVEGCCCPTRTRSWPSARRTRPSRATTTCRSSRASTVASARRSCASWPTPAPVSTSQDRAIEQAIAFLLAHRTDRRPKLRHAVEQRGDADQRPPAAVTYPSWARSGGHC